MKRMMSDKFSASNCTCTCIYVFFYFMLARQLIYILLILRLSPFRTFRALILRVCVTFEIGISSYRETDLRT